MSQNDNGEDKMSYIKYLDSEDLVNMSYTIKDNPTNIKCKKCGNNILFEIFGKLACMKCNDWVKK